MILYIYPYERSEIMQIKKDILNMMSVIISIAAGAADIIINYKQPYIEMFLIGAFFITRYMSVFADTKMLKWCFRVAMLIAYFYLCIISRSVFASLLFFGVYTAFEFNEHRVFEILTQAFLPSLLYFLCRIFPNGMNIDEIINMFVILAVSIVYTLIYYVVTVIANMRVRMNSSFAAFALSELKQKNLNDRLAVQNSLIEHNTRLEERENISRDIHNSVGHTIMASIMAIEAADILCDVDSERVHDKIKVARSRMGESMESVRRAVRLLDDGLTMTCDDFKAMLTITADRFMTDTEIHLLHNFSEISGGLLDKRNCEFLDSVLLEALTNGIKHGDATLFSAVLENDSNHIRLTVSDNGCGFSGLSESQRQEKLENGFGLKKILSYCERHGGSASINGDNGFTLVVSLPTNTENGGQTNE